MGEQFTRNPEKFIAQTAKATADLSLALGKIILQRIAENPRLADQVNSVVKAFATRVSSMSAEELTRASACLVTDIITASVMPGAATQGIGMAVGVNIGAIKTALQANIVQEAANFAQTYVGDVAPILLSPFAAACQETQKLLDVTAKEGIGAAQKAVEVVESNPLLIEGAGIGKAVQEVARVDNAFKLIEQQTEHAAGLRKVTFFDGLQHAKAKHFFGNKKESLKILDPGGTTEKWLQYITGLAQHEKSGLIQHFPDGDFMEIMGKMPKTDGSGILDIGVRLFKKNESTTWELTTILTRQ